MSDGHGRKGVTEEILPWPRASALSSRTTGDVHACTDFGCVCARVPAAPSYPAAAARAVVLSLRDCAGRSDVLPARYRMTRSTDFGLTVNQGVRAVQPDLVVHALQRRSTIDAPKIGLVVAKSVGNAVQRHRVARRLRHVARGVVDELDAGDRIVIRALPGSRRAVSARLEQELRTALRRTHGHPGAASRGVGVDPPASSAASSSYRGVPKHDLSAAARVLSLHPDV